PILGLQSTAIRSVLSGPFAGADERDERARRRRVLNDAAPGLRQSQHRAHPVGRDLFDLRQRRTGLPRETEHAEAGADVVAQHARQRAVGREVSEESRMLPVEQSRQHDLIEVVEDGRKWLRVVRRAAGQTPLDVARFDRGHHRSCGGSGSIIGNPIDEPMAGHAEFVTCHGGQDRLAGFFRIRHRLLDVRTMSVRSEVIMHRRASIRVAFALSVFFLAAIVTVVGQLAYPSARKGDTVDDYFGTKIADPYRWMEDLNSPELKRWIDAENTVTFKYLDSLPGRAEMRARITELWNYPKVSVPRFEGRRWFYTRNSGLQRQSVVFTRETLSGPETVVIDPNQLSPDGSLALSSWQPSPDGQHIAYGQSEGGSDWSTYYVREV